MQCFLNAQKRRCTDAERCSFIRTGGGAVRGSLSGKRTLVPVDHGTAGRYRTVSAGKSRRCPAAASAGTAAAYRQLDSPLSGHAPHRRPCGSSAGAGISTNLVASLAGVWYRHGLFRLGKFVAGSRRGVAAAAGNTAGTLLCRDSAEI